MPTTRTVAAHHARHKKVYDGMWIAAGVLVVLGVVFAIMWQLGLGPMHPYRPVHDPYTDPRVLHAIAKARGYKGEGVPATCFDPNGFAGMFSTPSLDSIPSAVDPSVVIDNKICEPCWDEDAQKFTHGASTVPGSFFTEELCGDAWTGGASGGSDVEKATACWKYLCGQGKKPACSANYYTADTAGSFTADGAQVAPAGWCTPADPSDTAGVQACIAASAKVCNGSSPAHASPPAKAGGAPTLAAASTNMQNKFEACWSAAQGAGVQNPVAVCSDILLRQKDGVAGSYTYAEWTAEMASMDAAGPGCCMIPTPDGCKTSQPNWCVRPCGKLYKQPLSCPNTTKA